MLHVHVIVLFTRLQYSLVSALSKDIKCVNHLRPKWRGWNLSGTCSCVPSEGTRGKQAFLEYLRCSSVNPLSSTRRWTLFFSRTSCGQRSGIKICYETVLVFRVPFRVPVIGTRALASNFAPLTPALELSVVLWSCWTKSTLGNSHKVFRKAKWASN